MSVVRIGRWELVLVSYGIAGFGGLEGLVRHLGDIVLTQDVHSTVYTAPPASVSSP